MTAITLAQLTEKKLDGNGVFDVLLQTLKMHLDTQYAQNRISGPEYSTVYLGQVNAAMQTGLAFIAQQQRIGLEADLLQKQIALAEAQLAIANAQLLQTQAQTTQIEAQTELINQQKVNAAAEKAQTEAQTALITSNKAKTDAETLLVPKQGLLLDAQTAVQTQQKANLTAEAANLPKQGLLIEAQTAMSTQQKANAIIEGTVLTAQECKLRAEYDYTVQNTQKSAAEITLVNQKVATEKAQILSLGVDDNSVIGKQKALYQAQTDGFRRDAEQKAAKMYIDVWSAQRMTDEATPASATNGLDAVTMGKVMAKLREGVGIAA